MRILLDENLNWRLKRDLPGHEVESVPLLGWAGIQNGALLRKAAENGFDVLMTMDSNMVYQQNLPIQSIAVIVLRAPSNRLADTQPLMKKVLSALTNIQKGTLTVIV
jgi:predicted nuclease of predicted toxin-antitoxin system